MHLVRREMTIDFELRISILKLRIVGIAIWTKQSFTGSIEFDTLSGTGIKLLHHSLFILLLQQEVHGNTNNNRDDDADNKSKITWRTGGREIPISLGTRF